MVPQFLIAAVAALALATPAQAQSSRETIAEVLPKMVKIFGAGGLRNLHAYSTGFLVSPDGHVATVWSHVLDAEHVTAILDDGRRFRAKVVAAEPPLDLAIIKLETDGVELPYFDLEEAAGAGPGTRVLAFSNMFKVATGDEPVSVLHGVIAAVSRLSARRGAFEIPYDGPVYVVDAITNNPGAGGGVITTRDGKLLGMIGKEVRHAESNTWINYSVPVTELREVIGQIISGDFTSRQRPADPRDQPNRYSAVDFGLVMVPDVLPRTPAYIDSIISGSPAAEAGLKRDDLVLFVNDQLIQSHRVLQTELGRLEAGDTLRLVVRRGSRLVPVELPVERKD